MYQILILLKFLLALSFLLFIINFNLIIYHLYIYDVTGSITIQPLIRPINRELVIFSVQGSVRRLKHCKFVSFESIDYTINLSIVLSFMVFSDLIDIYVYINILLV